MTGRPDIEELWQDPENWRWGVVYRCPDDPRVIVPRRWRWGGWTLNFSHPRAWLAGIASILIATVPGLTAALLIQSRPLTLLAMVASIVALVLWASYESGKKV